MAIMHRRKNLTTELEMMVDNLESLAKNLIRRVQLKGPYELLERTDVASGAWVEHEWQKLASLALEPEETRDDT
jgi:lipoate-protein ligase B